MRRETTTRRSADPRGSVYALVLITSTIVTLIGLSALSLSRLQAKRSEMSHNWMAAQIVAQSGLEYAMGRTEDYIAQAEAANRNWRDDIGPWFRSGIQSLGDGTFQWEAVDATGDNDITNNNLDPVIVTATSWVQNTSYALSVMYAPGPSDDPVDSLESMLHADRDIVINSEVNGSGLISANGSISATAASVYPDVAASGTISGGTYHGSQLPGDAARVMPSSNVFDYYLNNGTTIDIDDLYTWGGYAMYDTVLSPGTNPHGPQNPLGIYIIDCEGRDVWIGNMRLVGTLVLLNPGSNSNLGGKFNAEPAAPHFPVLLVDGPLHLSANATTPLDEPWWVSLNPTSTPYQGVSDSDWSDTFPSQVKGLIYASGDVLLDVDTVIYGTIISGGSIQIDAPLGLVENTAFRDEAPPGFKSPTGGRMAPVPGSIQRVVK